MEMLEKIRTTYIEYVLENGKQPASFFAFAKKLKVKEAALYEFYTSFESIESDLWKSFFEQAVATNQADETYQKYSVREKLLAIYYTWVELLKANRSFVVYGYKTFKHPLEPRTPQALKAFKEAFINFASDLVIEGEETREVMKRKPINKRYPDVLWLNTLYLLEFWVKDTSRNFELTDTAIEKTVNVAMDLMGRSLIDNVLDLAKFVYQNK